MERQRVKFRANTMYGGKKLLLALGFVGSYKDGYKHPCGASAWGPDYDYVNIFCTAEEYVALQKAAVNSGQLAMDWESNFESYADNAESVKEIERYKSTFGF